MVRKIGEDGVGSLASRMTQGIFVCHHDRTGVVLCVTKFGVVRGKKLDETDTERCMGRDELARLCGTPWQMVAPELKLTKKVAAKKERDPHRQGLWLKERRRLSPEDSTFFLRTLTLTDTLEAAQALERWHRMEERSNHTTTNVENESER